jgi:hypothetical protein
MLRALWRRRARSLHVPCGYMWPPSAATRHTRPFISPVTSHGRASCPTRTRRPFVLVLMIVASAAPPLSSSLDRTRRAHCSIVKSRRLTASCQISLPRYIDHWSIWRHKPLMAPYGPVVNIAPFISRGHGFDSWSMRGGMEKLRVWIQERTLRHIVARNRLQAPCSRVAKGWLRAVW